LRITRHMPPVSDEALLAGLASGDAVAAAAFVRRFQTRVFGLARTLAGDRGVAEEIAQETFLRAWRHADAYDPRRGRVVTWLLAIARNLAIDRLRLKSAEPVDPDRLIAIEAHLRGRVAGPQEQWYEELPYLRDAVSSLSDVQRRALLMSVFLGFTAREIGCVEAIPVGTAKTRIRTAMLKVRNRLEVGDEH
jgi:RNA polymerase sigma factor (sigma-70 family)